MVLTSSERALAGLQSQVRFDLAQASIAAAKATELALESTQELREARARHDAVVKELRQPRRAQTLDPVHHEAMQRLHRLESAGVAVAKRRFADAHDEQARAVSRVADLQFRDHALDRALEVERRRRRREELAREQSWIDDRFLQSSRRAK